MIEKRLDLGGHNYTLVSFPGFLFRPFRAFGDSYFSLTRASPCPDVLSPFQGLIEFLLTFIKFFEAGKFSEVRISFGICISLASTDF